MKKGFTLIELLVVIAIIGILAGIVLTSLNTARQKAQDAKVKSELAAFRASAEMFYDDAGNYTGLCASSDYGIPDLISGRTCTPGDDTWSLTAELPSGSGTWVVNESGYSGLAE
jgi:prepilin-type N-terminal cleavage/methylation domain-containing protein